MFETEAGFAETKMLINCHGDYSKKQDYKKGWQDGAEFGYNKANEWHYVKDGDLPKGNDTVLIYWKFGDKKCTSVVEPYKVAGDKYVIAWKEIVLPEESE